MAFKGLSGSTVKSENISYPYKIIANKDFELFFTDKAFLKIKKFNGKFLIAIEGYGRFWIHFSE